MYQRWLVLSYMKLKQEQEAHAATSAELQAIARDRDKLHIALMQSQSQPPKSQNLRKSYKATDSVTTKRKYRYRNKGNSKGWTTMYPRQGYLQNAKPSDEQI